MELWTSLRAIWKTTLRLCVAPEHCLCVKCKEVTVTFEEKLVGGLQAMAGPTSNASTIVAGYYNARLDHLASSRTSALADTLMHHHWWTINSSKILTLVSPAGSSIIVISSTNTSSNTPIHVGENCSFYEGGQFRPHIAVGLDFKISYRTIACPYRLNSKKLLEWDKLNRC